MCGVRPLLQAEGQPHAPPEVRVYDLSTAVPVSALPLQGQAEGSPQRPHGQQA